ncbi:MAG TPA: LuxR C-terminal-related transcriptional regulator [Planococcus sp. (in: firmicutes)]|nr:LuxR C-terminal-related transcriptional regulator [Planococcus sp. (in: firmicutes)]
MSVSLLSTKLYIPPLRAHAIARPRLTKKLLSGGHRPGTIILISGPAGFGKTTLLSEFANEIKGSVAWVSLDEGDNGEIGNKLGLSEGTVKNYVTSMLQKIGVRDRTQAALRGRELGLI